MCPRHYVLTIISYAVSHPLPQTPPGARTLDSSAMIFVSALKLTICILLFTPVSGPLWNNFTATSTPRQLACDACEDHLPFAS